MKDVLVHFIADDALMRGLPARSKSTPTPLLLDTLFRAGRTSATGFLDVHAADLNNRSTVDLAAMFG